jgi:MscS family membrane protein
MEAGAPGRNLTTDWPMLLEVWRHDLGGITVGQIALAGLILALALAARRLVGRVLLTTLRRWTIGDKTPAGENILAALAPPLRFVPILIALFAIAAFLDLPVGAKEVLADITRSLVAATFFWALFTIVEPAFSLLHGDRSIFNEAMVGWAVRVSRIVLLSLGAAVVLEIWGIHVGPILAGLGLVGVAVALGAQDLFKNLIAGIFIIGEQRFQTRDWILVDGVVEGTVETIGLRTTKVRRFDMAPVFVPNSKLADNALTNFSQMTSRRISWTIGLEYGATVDQLREVRDGIEALIRDNPDFAAPPEAPLFVRIADFGASSIDLMLYCFTRSTDWGEWLKTREALVLAIKALVEKAGTGFAFPSQSIYVESWPTGEEAFPLARGGLAPGARHEPDTAPANPVRGTQVAEG